MSTKFNYEGFRSYKSNATIMKNMLEYVSASSMAAKSYTTAIPLTIQQSTFYNRSYIGQLKPDGSTFNFLNQVSVSYDWIIPGGYVGDDYWYSRSAIATFLYGNSPVLVRYKAIQVKDLPDFSAKALHCYRMTAGRTIAEMTLWADWIAAHADEWLFFGIRKVFDNSNDGKYSAGSPRTLLVDLCDTCDKYQFQIYTHMNIDGVQRIDQSVQTPENWDGLLSYNYFMSHGYLNSANSVVLGFNSQEPSLGQDLAVLTGGSGTMISGYTYAIGYQMPWSAHGFTELVTFPTKTVLTKFLNNIGIPWTYDETEALTVNSSALSNYSPIGQGTNTTGGGTGDGDNTSDTIDLDTPAINSVSSCNQMYAMTGAQVNQFGRWLWTADWSQWDLKELFQSKAEAVIGLTLFPFSLSTHDSAHLSSDTDIVVGLMTSTAQGKPIKNGYNQVFSMGTFNISEYYGSAMDYSPYTSISIYLPYIGIKELDINEIMGRTITVKYIVDIANGSCVACIWAGSQLLYTISGTIGIRMPLNATNATQFYAQLVGAAAALGIGAVAGLAGAAAGAGAAAAGETAGAAGTAGGALTTGGAVSAGSVLSGAKNVASAQYHISKGGVVSPSAGLWMPQYCYLIIKRPIQSLSSDMVREHGFPCNSSAKLSSLSGYTEADAPIVSCSGTDAEKSEIQTLLRNGVII